MISRTAASMSGVQTPARAAVTREQFAGCDKLDLRFAPASGTRLRKPESICSKPSDVRYQRVLPGLLHLSLMR
jgi:hypothetical protein